MWRCISHSLSTLLYKWSTGVDLIVEFLSFIAVISACLFSTMGLSQHHWFSVSQYFQAELIDPAVKGTLNVLRSCTKVPSLKRVIITSSMASVMFDGKPLIPDVVIDETWFSDPTYCESIKVRICLPEIQTTTASASSRFTLVTIRTLFQ